MLTCAGWLLLVSCEGTPEREVWLIGLDGADWDILEPMMAGGELPHLAELRREGAWGRLQSDEPMLSPILWSSIATGKSADLHGVTWFMSNAPGGEKIPVSSHNRWVRALWHMTSEAGLYSGVIGWWATWPADPIEGFIVSDYVGWHSFGVTGRALEGGGKTYPPELYERIEPNFPEPASIPTSLLARMIHRPESELRMPDNASSYEEPLAHLRQAISTTLGYTQTALDMLDDERPAFLAVYFEGTDAVEHLFMKYAPPRLPWIEEADFAAYRDLVREYWKWQDEQLGRLLAERGPQTNVLVVSDHGFRSGDERLKEQEFSIELADASHLPDGIVVVHGPQANAGARLRGATIYDITPTVLRMLGLPVAGDFVGRVLEDAINVDVAPPSIATYESSEFPRGELDFGIAVESGEAMEEMLRSLGYISGGDESGGTPSSGNVEQAINLAVVQRRRGKLTEARRTLEAVLENDPTHVEARSNLARVLAEMGELDEAARMYGELVQDEPQNIAHYEDLALTLGRMGDDEAALEVYSNGLVQRPDWGEGHAGRAFALHQVGRSDEALVAVDRALELDPRLSNAHYYRAAILADLGRDQDAAASARRALELEPGHHQATLLLARLAGGDPNAPGALEALERAHALEPDDPELSSELGIRYLNGGRLQEALPLLTSSAERLPDDPQVQGNAGMAYAMTGDMNRAAQQFERVLELEPNSPQAMGTLGQIYLRSGRPEKAESLLRQAVELNPDEAGAHYSLGEFYHQTRQLDAAVEQYEAAIRLDPTVGAFHYQLAMIYGERGDETKARELVAKARELDPSLPPLPSP